MIERRYSRAHSPPEATNVTCLRQSSAKASYFSAPAVASADGRRWSGIVAREAAAEA